jgi:hypothetical protein
MIISASRRTDIPAFYSEWLINRLRDGHVIVPDPYNADRLWRVTLTPENVDCIVLWTKNPIAMLDRFEQLDQMGYRYYVHFTLTPYDRTVEQNLPPKQKLMQVFRKMSDRMGAARVVWRYDPIIVDKEHTVEWHLRCFEDMCDSLRGHTERCFISFVDPYKSCEKKFRTLTDDEMRTIASGFSEIAGAHNINVLTCAEGIDLSGHGVRHGACIDRELIERIIGYRITAKEDMNQRDACRCIECVDIGAYSTCSHGCSYCYATSGQREVMRRMAAHDPDSPMISGYPIGNETITDRTGPSQRNRQISIFHYE